MNTGTVVGLAVGGVGLWWLGNQLGWWGTVPATMSASPASNPTVAAPVVNAPAPVSASPIGRATSGPNFGNLANIPAIPAPANYTTLDNAVIQAAGGPNATVNADSWNFFWSQASGVPQTTDLFPAGNRDALLTFAQYLQARANAGLGLGQVKNPNRRMYPISRANRRNYIRRRAA